MAGHTVAVNDHRCMGHERVSCPRIRSGLPSMALDIAVNYPIVDLTIANSEYVFFHYNDAN